MVLGQNLVTRNIQQRTGCTSFGLERLVAVVLDGYDRSMLTLPDEERVVASAL
jgi:hypothetical protein